MRAGSGLHSARGEERRRHGKNLLSPHRSNGGRAVLDELKRTAHILFLFIFILGGKVNRVGMK